MSVRVRFAPSPTGILHVGNARTALFNWLLARHLGGTFVLRIEDTDRERSRPEFTADILDGLSWMGLDWDEGPDKGGPYGPYTQSERVDLYRQKAETLVREGYAYRCYCTEVELEAMREHQLARGQAPRYDRRCLSLYAEDRAAYEAQGRRPSIRFRVPDGHTVVVRDLIRGDVSFETDLLGDFVILKSDGMASYNFAVVVDDAGMGITHVVRGEDHLSNTPRQLLLYDALGLTPPAFAHMPMILGADRSKLSKRHGATAVTDYRAAGYLSEAFANYIALLGWAPPEGHEILAREEMVRVFELDRVGKSGAVFDLDKLRWVNEQWIRRKSPSELLTLARPFLGELSGMDEAVLGEAIALVQSSLVTLADLPGALFFLAPPVREEALRAEVFADPAASRVLADFATYLERGDLAPEVLKAWFKAEARALGLKMPDAYGPLRFALTGQVHGPDLARIIALLGREEAGRRVAEVQPTLG